MRNTNRVLDKTASTQWKEAQATVISSDYHYARLRDLNLDDSIDHSYFVITFSYVVNGEAFYDNFEQYEPLTVGEQFSILYDPERPSRNSLSKVDEPVLFRVVVWSLGIALVALLIYLQYHFKLPNIEFPTE